MRLRRWIRRRRLTTPPEAIPLIVVAIVAMAVAQLAIGLFLGICLVLYLLVTDPSALWEWWLVPPPAAGAAGPIAG